MPDTTPGPQIVEAYRNYSPPFDVSKTIRILLRYVPANYLVGLKTIVLTNQEALSHDQRRRRPWSRGRKHPMERVRGDYTRAWKGQQASIRLFVDRIIASNPAEAKWLPLLRNSAFAQVLYHEIGHHIHKTCKPEFREREDVADEWRDRLGRKFMRSRYWYLRPVFIVYRLVTKPRKVFSEVRTRFRRQSGTQGKV